MTLFGSPRIISRRLEYLPRPKPLRSMELLQQTPTRRAILGGLTLGLTGLLLHRRGLIAAPALIDFTDSPSQPREAGIIRWSRHLPEAIAESRRTGRLIMVLFQEIPGCQGCVDFGTTVLGRHDLAAAAEDAFVPLLVYNNKPGTADDAVRAKFGEPAWNFPVVRFLNEEGRDAIPRQDQVMSAIGMSNRMLEALAAVKQAPPEGLAGIPESSGPPPVESAVFTQPCFWEGERLFGGQPGVVATAAGFTGGREGTAVWFDPSRTSRQQLLKAGQLSGCAGSVQSLESFRPAPAADQKRQLAGTPYARLRLSRARQARLNAVVRTDPAAAKSLLTPQQRRELASLE